MQVQVVNVTSPQKRFKISRTNQLRSTDYFCYDNITLKEQKFLLRYNKKLSNQERQAYPHAMSEGIRTYQQDNRPKDLTVEISTNKLSELLLDVASMHSEQKEGEWPLQASQACCQISSFFLLEG